MEVKNLICISCPLGCDMNVTMENGEVVKVEGNTCPKGEQYARKELVNPERAITSTVRLIGGDSYLVSVKTQKEIPKSKIFDVIEVINKTTAKSPVKVGDVIVKNIANTGIDLVATKNA